MRLITNKDVPSYANLRHEIKINMFDCPEDYVSFQSTIPRSLHRDDAGDSAWSGGTHAENVSKLINGDFSNMDAAQAILDKLEVSELLTNNIPLLETCIAGFVPCVPAVLAGQPETMFSLVESEQPNIQAPIRIFVEVAVSASLTNAEINNRGVAIVALVMAMNTVRPVEVYASFIGSPSDSHGSYGNVVRLASTPLDLGRALYMLTSPGYARALSFAGSNMLGGKLLSGACWPFRRSYMGLKDDEYMSIYREAIGCEPNDIFIMGGHIKDKLMLTQPIEWVNQMVKAHTA